MVINRWHTEPRASVCPHRVHFILLCLSDFSIAMGYQIEIAMRCKQTETRDREKRSTSKFHEMVNLGTKRHFFISQVHRRRPFIRSCPCVCCMTEEWNKEWMNNKWIYCEFFHECVRCRPFHSLDAITMRRKIALYFRVLSPAICAQDIHFVSNDFCSLTRALVTPATARMTWNT